MSAGQRPVWTSTAVVTAGHCFPNGALVTTETGRAYGVVPNRHIDSDDDLGLDLELLGQKPYWGAIYTGGVNSSTSLPVKGAGDPTIGATGYCHSGRTSEHCGHQVASNTAQVCTETGCVSPAIAFTGGGAAQPGDSGAPFYATSTQSGGVFIRGHVIAIGVGVAYAEPYRVTAARLNVSIIPT